MAKRWRCCCCWVSSRVPCCGMWYPCVGEMNVWACSYHCWLAGGLNGQCSGAVRMNGWLLSSHDNLQPTHGSNPPPEVIDLALIDSFSPTFSFFVRPSLRSLCPGQKDQARSNSQLPQQPATWRYKRWEWWPQPWTGWVSSFFFLNLFALRGVWGVSFLFKGVFRTKVEARWAAAEAD